MVTDALTWVMLVALESPLISVCPGRAQGEESV